MIENELYNSPASETRALGLEGKKMAQRLGWLGVIPMVALAGLAALNGPEWASVPLISYAALILAFMAGTLWAELIYAQRVTRHAIGQLLASNALVLAAWPAVLMPTTIACVWLSVLFLVHLLLDQPWRSMNRPAWYRHMRLTISLTVIGLLMLGGLIGLGMDFWSQPTP